jgi:hypothetical protein
MILMNKKIASIIIFASSLCLARFASAQEVTIPNPLQGTDSISELLTDKILPGVAGIVASLSTIMIIIAGILYLTSAGSPEKINTAKKAITYAIVGLVIAIAAGTIATIIKTTLGVT